MSGVLQGKCSCGQYTLGGECVICYKGLIPIRYQDTHTCNQNWISTTPATVQHMRKKYKNQSLTYDRFGL